MQVDRSGGLGWQLRCIAGCKKVALAQARGTFAKNDIAIAFKSELVIDFFEVSLGKGALISPSLIDVEIVSLICCVFLFSLFFNGFRSIFNVATGV